MASTVPDVHKTVVAAFAMWAEGKGHLDRHGLKCAYATLHGTRPSRAHLDSLMRDAVAMEDTDGLVLPWQAFAARMEALLRMQDPDEHVRKVFKSFDQDACGFISRAHAHAAFKNAAPSVSSRVVDEVFDELDLDNDGRVSCRDFITMMRSFPGV